MVESTYIAVAILSMSASFGIYLMKKYMDAEEMKRDLSLILYHEIRYNEKITVKNDEFDRKDIVTYFNTNVYDGIVASTNIRYFPNYVQEILHDLYHDIRWKNNDCKSQLALANIKLIEHYEANLKITKANCLNILKTMLYYGPYGTFCNIVKTIFVLRYEQMYANYEIRG